MYLTMHKLPLVVPKVALTTAATIWGTPNCSEPNLIDQVFQCSGDMLQNNLVRDIVVLNEPYGDNVFDHYFIVAKSEDGPCGETYTIPLGYTYQSAKPNLTSKHTKDTVLYHRLLSQYWGLSLEHAYLAGFYNTLFEIERRERYNSLPTESLRCSKLLDDLANVELYLTEQCLENQALRSAKYNPDIISFFASTLLDYGERSHYSKDRDSLEAKRSRSEYDICKSVLLSEIIKTISQKSNVSPIQSEVLDLNDLRMFSFQRLFKKLCPHTLRMEDASKFVQQLNEDILQPEDLIDPEQPLAIGDICTFFINHDFIIARFDFVRSTDTHQSKIFTCNSCTYTTAEQGTVKLDTAPNSWTCSTDAVETLVKRLKDGETVNKVTLEHTGEYISIMFYFAKGKKRRLVFSPVLAMLSSPALTEV